MEKIDFVLTWVDGSDPDWLAQRREYQPGRGTDAGESRYRDWDNLQYWFRGVEKFAPWVNKIYFVTWGHVPKWLNTAHEKIRIVKHEDFMAPAYLPTFNINSIELNLHRIKGLSEHFVFFNDDMFLIDSVRPEDYFKNGLREKNASAIIHLYMQIGLCADPAWQKFSKNSKENFEI